MTILCSYITSKTHGELLLFWYFLSLGKSAAKKLKFDTYLPIRMRKSRRSIWRLENRQYTVGLIGKIMTFYNVVEHAIVS
jgi:hypothetical protein